MQTLQHVPEFSVMSAAPADSAPDLRKYFGSIMDRKWLVAAVALLVILLGTSYAFIAAPVYESNLLIQVEDPSSMPSSPFGNGSEGQDAQVNATAREIEVLRSRLVVSSAVDQNKLFIDVAPVYFPVIGAAIARYSEGLSEPGLFGLGGYAWGKESATVGSFNVPRQLEGLPFTLTAGEGGSYTLSQEDEAITTQGRVGEPLHFRHGSGEVELLVASIAGRPGAQFTLARLSRTEVIRKLQESLQISEKGKQSGVISVKLEGAHPVRVTDVLSTIANNYLAQNEDRKSQTAEKQLAFLDRQLPILKQELERSETSYNALRNKRGTVDLGEEARNALSQSVTAQTKIAELRQKKEDLLTRFREEHPSVLSVNQQLESLQRELSGTEGRIKKLPVVEQDVVRLARDVEVGKQVYAAVLTSAHQLRIVTASKAPNVRLLDMPVVSYVPVKPRRAFLVVLSAVAGVLLGALAALGKKGLFGKVDYPQEVEESLGLPVTATIPYSTGQKLIGGSASSPALRLLPQAEPYDQAVEGLRDLRTLVRDGLPNASNNVVMITGPVPGVGKSFVSANLAMLLASVGSKVLLIDGDMRTGRLHRYFGHGRENGLADVIAGKTSYAAAIRRDVVANVDFMPCGDNTPRPAELLEAPAFVHLLQMLSARYDVVLIDTPPVIGLPDALSVAAHAGMVFNIVRARATTMQEIEETARRLSQGGRKITGTVFNGLKPGSASHRYGVGRKYRYGESEA